MRHLDLLSGIGGLGNTIVPQVAAEINEWIKSLAQESKGDWAYFW